MLYSRIVKGFCGDGYIKILTEESLAVPSQILLTRKNISIITPNQFYADAVPQILVAVICTTMLIVVLLAEAIRIL